MYVHIYIYIYIYIYMYVYIYIYIYRERERERKGGRVNRHRDNTITSLFKITFSTQGSF